MGVKSKVMSSAEDKQGDVKSKSLKREEVSEEQDTC